MKKLQFSPPNTKLPSVATILGAIPWIEKEPQLINLIIEIARPKTFQIGKVIIHYGDNPAGIHIIISGLVKVCIQ